MSTSNIQVTSSWVKVVDTSKGEFLITWTGTNSVEFATTSADTAPVVTGHLINPAQALSRAAIGPGHVWAKVKQPVMLVISND